MAKIMLFGASTIFDVPEQVITWLEEYIKQGHEFIIGDNKGADASFHKALSSLGIDREKVKIYCMDSVRNNKFEFPVRKFITGYNEELHQVEIVEEGNEVNEHTIIEGVNSEIDIANTKEWYEFKDRKMISDCDMAISLWDGKQKGTFHIIQLMNINNKPCYTFTLQI